MAGQEGYQHGVQALMEKPAFDANAPVQPEYGQDETPEKIIKKHNKTKTVIGFVACVGLVAGGGVAWQIADFWNGYVNALKPRTTVDGAILAKGQALVETTNLNINKFPVAENIIQVGNPKTLAGALDVGMSKNITSTFINFPYQKTTLKRTEAAEDTVNVDPTKVDIEFNVKTDKATFIVSSDLALTSEVHTVPGSDKTVDGSNWNLLPVDVLNDFANEAAGLLQLFGKNVDSSQIPVAGGTASSVTATHSALENYADLTILTGVDKECTPQLSKIPGFTQGLKTNIVEAVRGVLLDPAFTNSPEHKDIAVMVDRKVDKLQEIIDNADVEFKSKKGSSSADYTIGPDQATLDTYNKFTKSTFYKTLGKASIDCSIKGATLIKPKSDLAAAEAAAKAAKSKTSTGANK